MADTFDEYENNIFDIGRNIYKSYVDRFIKKQYVTVPREEFTVIRECHSWHLDDRTNNRISLDKIINVLNQQSPTHLNHMIKRFNLEIRQKDLNITKSVSVIRNDSFDQSPTMKDINPTSVNAIPPLFLGKNVAHNKNNKNHHSRTASILLRKPLYKPKNVTHPVDDSGIKKE